MHDDSHWTPEFRAWFRAHRAGVSDDLLAVLDQRARDAGAAANRRADIARSKPEWDALRVRLAELNTLASTDLASP